MKHLCRATKRLGVACLWPPFIYTAPQATYRSAGRVPPTGGSGARSSISGLRRSFYMAARGSPLPVLPSSGAFCRGDGSGIASLRTRSAFLDSDLPVCLSVAAFFNYLLAFTVSSFAFCASDLKSDTEKAVADWKKDATANKKDVADGKKGDTVLDKDKQISQIANAELG